MRKSREDKLDKINRENNMKANVIKWWNVIMKYPEREKDRNAEEEDVFSADNTMLYENILKENHRDEDPYENAMQNIKETEEKNLEEANKIYERLMMEAQQDEEKKRREIEEAKRMMEANDIS